MDSPSFKDSASFKDYLAKRVANQATVIRKQPRLPTQDWQIDIGPVVGVAGTITTVFVQPQVLFRCEKIIATDSYGNDLVGGPQPGLNGYGTRIGRITVGQLAERPALTYTLTRFFAFDSIANGVKFRPCPEALKLSVQVSFIQTCVFDLTMFGKALP
jgi:hypothetical protein